MGLILSYTSRRRNPAKKGLSGTNSSSHQTQLVLTFGMLVGVLVHSFEMKCPQCRAGWNSPADLETPTGSKSAQPRPSTDRSMTNTLQPLLSTSSTTWPTEVQKHRQIKNIRAISPTEAERLLGFPDDWTYLEYTDADTRSGHNRRKNTVGTMLQFPSLHVYL